MLDQAGLREFERVRTGELSGGMRQRLGLALLLLPDAPVLLLDEPGLSLDPGWRKRLQETLHFEAERGKTVLVTTHLVAEWNNVAHRCLLCRDGKIERELDPTNLPHDFDELPNRCAIDQIDQMNLALSLADLTSRLARGACCASFAPRSSIVTFRSSPCLSLLGGLAAILFSEDANAIGFFVLQIALYFVSLFALLAGVSSAQAERDEWQLLFAQPVPRGGLRHRKIYFLLVDLRRRARCCFFCRR